MTTKSRADGTYIITLDPGTYDVGFNAAGRRQDQRRLSDGHLRRARTRARPTTCTICGGAPVTVAAGVVTANINAVLPPSPSPRPTIRPLSGNTIGLVNGRVNFKIGCHASGRLPRDRQAPPGQHDLRGGHRQREGVDRRRRRHRAALPDPAVGPPPPPARRNAWRRGERRRHDAPRPIGHPLQAARLTRRHGAGPTRR